MNAENYKQLKILLYSSDNFNVLQRVLVKLYIKKIVNEESYIRIIYIIHITPSWEMHSELVLMVILVVLVISILTTK